MRAVRLVGLVFLVVLVVGDAVAQNRFFADGESGLWTGIALVDSEDAGGFAVDATFTLGSEFDLGLGYAKATSDDRDTKVTEFTPHLAFAALRPAATSAVGVDVLVGVSFADVKDPYYDRYNVEASAGGYTVGAEIYGQFGAAHGVLFFPALGLAYASTTQTLDNGLNTFRTTVEGAMISASVTAQVRRILTLSAGMQTFDETSTWFVGVGGAFQLDRGEP